MSYDSSGVDDEFFAYEDSTGYMPNIIIIYILNFVTIIMLLYTTLILFLNRADLHLLYDAYSIGVLQSVMVLILLITLYFNSKLLLILDSSWKIITATSASSFMLCFIQALILLQNPTVFRYSDVQPENVMISLSFWTVLFYPLLILFYIAPIIAWIELNEKYEGNMNISLLLFLGSSGLLLFAESSKIWNVGGWMMLMISYNVGFTDIGGVNFVATLSNFNTSTLGVIVVLTSMLLLAVAIWFLYQEIRFQPNSIHAIIPYGVFVFVLTIDSVFSNTPADVRLLNVGLIIGWILIIVIYTVAYSLIPNSILNSRVTGEISFKPKIISRMSDKKLETQILDTIEENEIRKIIEISSFLSVPYHHVLKCLKSLILQGYLQGRILKQQFVKVGELNTFESEYEMSEFPSSFEIWKLTMRNEGVISVDNLANIMTYNSRDLDQVLLHYKEIASNFDNYVDGYLYINKIEDLDELHEKIKDGLNSLSESKIQANNEKQ